MVLETKHSDCFDVLLVYNNRLFLPIHDRTDRNSSLTHPAIGHKMKVYLTFTGWPWMRNMGKSSLVGHYCVGFAEKNSRTPRALYAHITTQVEPTYVCIVENLGNLIGWAFSTLKTHLNRDRIRVTVSPLLL